jgi:hypothetical protein
MRGAGFAFNIWHQRRFGRLSQVCHCGPPVCWYAWHGRHR